MTVARSSAFLHRHRFVVRIHRHEVVSSDPAFEVSMPTLVAESPVRSLKAGDPDYAELLELFASEVAQRATEMQHLFARGDLEQLRVMATTR